MKLNLKNLKMIPAVLLVLASATFVIEKSEILSRVENDKQGLPSKVLTGDRTRVPQGEGGVSDGGGNAVGVTLFDFYENEGSQELSITELLNREPIAKKMILDLDKEVPAVGNINSIGFGSLLLNSVQGKKLFLENKEISSVGCQNQSMVATSEQAIVACQSDTEIRFSAQWLKSANPMNRAGLIMHELLLAWARKHNGHKEETEASVRRLNRMLFAADKSQYAQTINEVFEVHAFSAENLVKAKSKVKISLTAIENYKNTQALNSSQLRSLDMLSSAIGSGTVSSGECSILVEIDKELPKDQLNKICSLLKD